ncbi:MAG: CgeB family protein [Candidatus Limnocylindrales bacterium]
MSNPMDPTSPGQRPAQPGPEELASFRRRERLLDQIARSRASFRAKERELSLMELRLTTAQHTLGYRVERAIRGRLHRLRSVLSRPSQPTAAVQPTRAGDAPRPLIQPPAVPAGPLELVLLVDPPPNHEPAPAGMIRAAWLGDQADRWLGSTTFNDIEIVLVPDEATRTLVEARSAKAAWITQDPAGPAGAAALDGILDRWLVARHVAIHIGAPTWTEAGAWGDLPFARDVQRAFERRGWPSSVPTFADADSAAAVRADLAIHLAGIRAPTVRPGQISVLWIISHPDSVRRELCLAYDLVGVASDPFLAYLRTWLGAAAPPLIPLHQATDPERFFPEPGGPAHDLLFVGSARHGRRPFLDTLRETNHDVAVYGRNWTADLLDPASLRGEWIANDDLHRYYASAAICLSDSWADMRDEGFISNRVYDVLASAGFVISEAVAGLDREFDRSVVAYHDLGELVERVDHYLARPDERAALARAGRAAVLARHTFGHRVEAIIANVDPLIGPKRAANAEPARGAPVPSGPPST